MFRRHSPHTCLHSIGRGRAPSAATCESFSSAMAGDGAHPPKDPGGWGDLAANSAESSDGDSVLDMGGGWEALAGSADEGCDDEGLGGGSVADPADAPGEEAELAHKVDQPAEAGDVGLPPEPKHTVSEFWSEWCSTLRSLSTSGERWAMGLPPLRNEEPLPMQTSDGEEHGAPPLSATASAREHEPPVADEAGLDCIVGPLSDLPGQQHQPDAYGGHGRLGQLVSQVAEATTAICTLLADGRQAIPGDSATMRILGSDLSGRNVSMNAGSATAQAERLGVSRHKLRDVRRLHAGATILVQIGDLRRVLKAVEQDTKRAGGSLVSFSTFVRYDETPMKLAVVDTDVLLGLPTELFDVRAVSLESQNHLRQALRDTAPAKLLQMELMFSCLVRLGERFVLLAFRVVCPVQAMARTTACVYFDSAAKLEATFNLEDVQSQYNRVQRASCTDGDGAIAKAERARLAVHEREANLRTICVLHKLCANREAVCDLAPLLCRQIKHVVLSLRFGNHMKTFRSALRTVLLERLHIERAGRPSPAILRRNMSRLSAFLPDALENKTRKLTILALCTGDWSDTQRITVHAKAGESDATIKAKLIGPFAAAICGAGPSSFPSRNFVRCEESLQWVGALEAVHNLFSAAYLKFCACLEGRQASGAKQSVTLLLVDSEVPPRFGVLAAEGSGGTTAEEAVGEAADVGALADHPPGVANAIGDDAWTDRQKEQHRFRATAAAWTRSGVVLRDMLVLLGALRPHVDLMAKEMYLCGDNFEREQQVRLAATSHGLDVGSHPSGTSSQRRYRIACAYDGESTKDFLDKTLGLMTSGGRWEHVPFELRMQSLRSLTFMMLARGFALAHRLQHARQNYPYKLLAMVAHPALAGEIAADKECPKRLDPWSRNFVDHYQNIRSAEAMADLASTAQYAREETLSIERNHSRLRRYIVGRGVQSKCVDLSGLNQHWTAAFFEGPAHGVWGAPKETTPPPTGAGCADQPDAPDAPPAKRARKLSAWNVFWSEQVAAASAAGGAKPTPSAMGEAFRKIPTEERERLALKARYANDAVQAGSRRPLRGDGPVPLPAPLGDILQLAPLLDRPDDLSIVAALDPSEDLFERLRGASQLVRRERQSAKAKESTHFTAMMGFRSDGSMGAPLVDAVVAAGAQYLSEHARSFCAHPQSSPSLSVLEWSSSDARRKAALAVSGLSKSVTGSKHPDKVGLFYKSLDSVWGALMQPIQHASVEAVESHCAAPQPLQERLCHVANHCVCVVLLERLANPSAMACRKH